MGGGALQRAHRKTAILYPSGGADTNADTCLETDASLPDARKVGECLTPGHAAWNGPAQALLARKTALLPMQQDAPHTDTAACILAVHIATTERIGPAAVVRTGTLLRAHGETAIVSPLEGATANADG